MCRDEQEGEERPSTFELAAVLSFSVELSGYLASTVRMCAPLEGGLPHCKVSKPREERNQC